MGAFKLVRVSLSSWMNCQQQHVIDYLQEEIGSLRGGAQFCEHYHRERNHQGLDNEIIEPDHSSDGEGEVQCRQRLGGQLRYYCRDAP